MMSLEAYQDLIMGLLIRDHGYAEQNVIKRLNDDPIVPHCFLNGRDPVKVAAALASKWKRWNQI